ncbi:major facilitator transporter [Hymenobacter sp. DG25B]|uniref:MFS transporter n=1 Tax=Hymenobacter sp. DG25B TaxID=1385664 RepID=UPI0005411DAE|nr:MFS transporter [Hymenobacter sp. DG25B]AIZ62672.1 major facilitator transporter [Hymenobacter sp. DG25B]
MATSVATASSTREKPRLSFWQIWNMSFGFLGIQFGFALQNANVSRIFETMGAKTDDIAILWLAAPTTGLLVQPIIGYMSDRTWSPRWGRRRPYFMIGAILASLALLVMPNVTALWMAAGMLWIMDSSINISMEPFRALVGDLLPSSQRTTGFAAQTFFIGIGAIVASSLPWIFTNWFNISNTAPAGHIPLSVKYAFYIGGIVFFLAVLWTVLRTKEYPPEDMNAFEEEKRRTAGFWNGVRESFMGVFNMPQTMRQLAIVQFFSWLALFAMWIYTTPAITSHIYHTTDTTSKLYNEGADWVGVCFSVYNGVSAVFALLLPIIARRTSRRVAHMLCLIAGGLGLISIYFIQDPKMLLVSMVGVGIAWASILSVPYAMLAGALPWNKMGYYMGVFNFFIVIPQMVAGVTLGFFTKHVFGGESVMTLVLGGASMIIAGLFTLRVHDADDIRLPADPTALAPESPAYDAPAQTNPQL